MCKLCNDGADNKNVEIVLICAINKRNFREWNTYSMYQIFISCLINGPECRNIGLDLLNQYFTWKERQENIDMTIDRRIFNYLRDYIIIDDHIKMIQDFNSFIQGLH